MVIELENKLDEFFEENTLEEFLEHFDLTPTETIKILFDNGFLDEELMENLL